MATFKRITIDPKIMSGRPCIRGMRVTVGMIIDLLNDDWSHKAVVQAYPHLQEADIREAVKYADWWKKERKKPQKL